jgi:hypothetical protein
MGYCFFFNDSKHFFSVRETPQENLHITFRERCGKVLEHYREHRKLLKPFSELDPCGFREGFASFKFYCDSKEDIPLGTEIMTLYFKQLIKNTQKTYRTFERDYEALIKKLEKTKGSPVIKKNRGRWPKTSI